MIKNNNYFRLTMYQFFAICMSNLDSKSSGISPSILYFGTLFGYLYYAVFNNQYFNAICDFNGNNTFIPKEPQLTKLV